MIAALLLGLAASAATAGATEQQVFLSWSDGARVCSVEVGGVTIHDFETGRGQAEFVAKLTNLSGIVHVIPKKTGAILPYRCTLRVSDALRKAGFHGAENFDLGELPPPPPAP